MIKNEVKQSISITFIFLSIFVLLRPIFTISIFTQHSFLNLTLLELFGIVSSGLLMALIFFRLPRVKFDGISFLLFGFCCYVILSFFWGENYQDGIRLIFPIIVFFAARAIIENEIQIKKLLVFLLLGFLIPVLGSSFLILQGKSLSMTIFWTGVERYSGLYLTIHPLAHSMLVFIFMAILFIHSKHGNAIKEKFFLYSVYIVSIFSLYNIYKSVTRTVFVGLLIFLSIYLVGRRKYIPLLFVFVFIFSSMIFSAHVQEIFFDVIGPLTGEAEIGKIGSGRVGGLQDTLSLFFDLPVEKQILGLGIGNELQGDLAVSHNDLLSILISLGYIGILWYLMIILKVIFDTFRSNIDRMKKFIFTGIIISILAMNLGSNSYISRFELGQYFYLILGMCYALIDIGKTKINDKGEKK